MLPIVTMSFMRLNKLGETHDNTNFLVDHIPHLPDIKLGTTYQPSTASQFINSKHPRSVLNQGEGRPLELLPELQSVNDDTRAVLCSSVFHDDVTPPVF